MSTIHVAKGLARRTGYRIARIDSDAEVSGHLRQLLPMLNVHCVVDIGANRGQFVDLLRGEVGFRGKIVSFEPTAAAFAAITAKHGHDPLWSGRKEAVGSVPGQAEINVFKEDNFSSFLSATPTGGQLWSTLQQVERTEKVPVRRLDEAWESLSLPDRVFLKVDTQGRDLDVLASLGNRVQSVLGLMTEVPVQHLYQGTRPFCDTLTALLELGFEMTGLFAENRDDRLRLVEMNAVLRRVVDEKTDS